LTWINIANSLQACNDRSTRWNAAMIDRDLRQLIIDEPDFEPTISAPGILVVDDRLTIR
jgi:hypothetical protein